MISDKEFSELRVGDVIYLFRLEISSTTKRINCGIAVELSKISEPSKFRVERVINGKILRVGETIEITNSWRVGYRKENLWKSIEAGVEWWNSQLERSERILTEKYTERRNALIERRIVI